MSNSLDLAIWVLELTPEMAELEKGKAIARAVVKEEDSRKKKPKKDKKMIRYQEVEALPQGIVIE